VDYIHPLIYYYCLMKAMKAGDLELCSPNSKDLPEMLKIIIIIIIGHTL